VYAALDVSDTDSIICELEDDLSRNFTSSDWLFNCIWDTFSSLGSSKKRVIKDLISKHYFLVYPRFHNLIKWIV
jgi:hypothetical protein